jgi:hypothetical protein
VKRTMAAAARRWRPTLLALKPALAAAADSMRARGRRMIALIKERWTTLRSNP